LSRARKHSTAAGANLVGASHRSAIFLAATTLRCFTASGRTPVAMACRCQMRRRHDAALLSRRSDRRRNRRRPRLERGPAGGARPRGDRFSPRNPRGPAMTDCTVTPEAIAELAALSRRLTLSFAVKSPKPSACWEAQVAFLRFIEEHPTLIPVMAERALRLRDLADEMAAWGVRDFPLAGSDVLRTMVNLKLIGEADAVR